MHGHMNVKFVSFRVDKKAQWSTKYTVWTTQAKWLCIFLKIQFLQQVNISWCLIWLWGSEVATFQNNLLLAG